jgi:hypothetical protein
MPVDIGKFPCLVQYADKYKRSFHLVKPGINKTWMQGGTWNIRAYPNKWTKIWRTILLAHFRNIAKSTRLQE